MSMSRRWSFLAACAVTPGAMWGQSPAAGGPRLIAKSNPPAPTRYAFRARDLTSFSSDHHLTLSCLQGLASRRQPQLYVVHDRYDELPVFRAVNRPPGSFTFTPAPGRGTEFFEITEIRRWTPPQRSAFVYAFLANWFTTMDMGESLLRGLGSEYVPVRPDQLAVVYRESLA